MAERRMFAKTIIDSDAFLDMPLSTQALYFHLSMRADDEGFINNPKKIQRMVNATDDDFRVLVTKKFIIPFETGIVVIKHWRIHNYIRADRLVETKYQDERSRLEIKENGAYTLFDDAKQIEHTDSAEMRMRAYENSILPYSFNYKIKRAFEGKICPQCGRTMTSSVKTLMPTVQHNKPISKGGEHDLGNISVICESCNTSIRDTETGELNNKEVIEIWDKITYAERNKIDWFANPALLNDIDVNQMSDICQPNDRIGKDRLGKDSLGKDRIEHIEKPKPPTLEEISAYIISKNYIIDAKDFFDYYESNDWKTKEGKSMKKNWKQYVVTWNNREKKSQSERQPQKRLPDFKSPYKSVIEEPKPITIEEQEIKGRYVVDEDYVLPEPPTIMDFGIYCRDHNILKVNPVKIHDTYIDGDKWKEGIKYFDMKIACERAKRNIAGIPEEFYQLPKKWEDEE